MTPHERAVKVVNDWYDNEDAKRPELILAVTNAIMANNNQELEGYRKKKADLEDRLAQSDAHRKMLVRDYKQIQDRLSEVAVKKRELAHTNQELLSTTYHQSKLITEIFGYVSAGAYQGFDYSDVVARIKAKILLFQAKGFAVWIKMHPHDTPDQTHHNED